MLNKWINQEKIYAIHLRDLEQNLAELGILDSVINGTISCFHCESHLTLEEIQCLFMVEDEIHLCCNRPDCFNVVLEMKETYSK